MTRFGDTDAGNVAFISTFIRVPWAVTRQVSDGRSREVTNGYAKRKRDSVFFLWRTRWAQLPS